MIKMMCLGTTPHLDRGCSVYFIIRVACVVCLVLWGYSVFGKKYQESHYFLLLMFSIDPDTTDGPTVPFYDFPLYSMVSCIPTEEKIESPTESQLSKIQNYQSTSISTPRHDT